MLMPSSTQEDATIAPAFDPASAVLPDGFYDLLVQSVAAHDLSSAMVSYARELVGLQEGLSAFEQGALTLLVLATLVEQRRGSTRLPIHSLRGAGAQPPADLQADGGRVDESRLVEIIHALVAPEDGEDTEPGAPVSDYLKCLAGLLESEACADLVGGPGDYRPLIVDGPYLYQQRMLFFEDRLLIALRQRLGLADFAVAPETVRGALAATLGAMPSAGEGRGSMQLNREQKYALLSAVYRPFTVISGGPGTGKTSIVVSVLRLLARLGVAPDEVALAAPTGKAAHRLGDAIQSHLQALPANEDGVDEQLLNELDGARTLHRLLGYSPARNDYYYHENNRLPHRVVIVDEASMIDLFLMERLLSAVEPGARLILLGDADQLPSVDAGAVFRDLVPSRVQMRSDWLALLDEEVVGAPAGSGVLASHAVRLETSYRMDPKSPAGGEILRAAKALNRGDYAELFEGDAAGVKVREGFAAIESAGVEICEPGEGTRGLDAQLINSFVEWWYGQRVANLDGFRELIFSAFEFDGEKFSPQAQGDLDRLFGHFSGFQALSITRVFGTGSEALNAALHARHMSFLGFRAGTLASGRLAVGEPIIMLRNDYERGLFNGDQGLVLDVLIHDENGRYIKSMAVFLRDGEYMPFDLAALGADLEHAYALTIHKAQGSEYNSVGIVLPHESLPLLSREILYTGMTRSRRSVLLVGAREQVEAAAKNSVRRFSGVADKLAMR